MAAPHGPTHAGTSAMDHALRRVVAEIHDGLRHGFFELTLTCEIVSDDRRRLTVRAGKSYQFVIPKEDCMRSARAIADSPDGSDTNDT